MSEGALSTEYASADRAGASFLRMIIEDPRASKSWLHESDNWPRGDHTHQNRESWTTRTDLTEGGACPYEAIAISSTFDSAFSKDARTLKDDFQLDSHAVEVFKENEAPSSSAPIKRPRPLGWYTRWFRDWWALEIGSMFLGTICIVAIAIMLLQVDGREMPRWRLGVTIDAILSVLSGLSKSCLLMPTAEALGQLKWPFGNDERRAIDVERIDKASRGTWGSVVLLARARGVTLASLGAAIILLSLPLDLCFQQVVRYPVERILDSTVNATISRAVVYDPLDDYTWRGDDWSLSEDQGTTAFLYSSWFADAPVGPGLAFSCPTGNCTFEDFETLALDFECKPLSQTFLTHGCYNASARWHSTFSIAQDDPRNMSSCGYYLDIPDHGLELMSGFEVKADGSLGETLAMNFFELSDLWTNQQYLNGSIKFGHIGERVIDFVLASTPQAFAGARMNQTPILQECEIHWAVHKIRSEVRNGELFEKKLSSLVNNQNFGPYWAANDSNWYTFSPAFALPDAHSPDGASTYRASNITARKIWQSFTQRIPSTFVQPNDERPLRDTFMVKESWLSFTTPYLKVLPDSTLPWDTFHGTVSHMTKLIDVVNEVIRNNRLSQRGQGDVVVGTAFRNVVMVRVNWEWFAFPAALWCVAVIFLAITIWRTSRMKDSGAYKTSLLPMLLDRDIHANTRDLKSAKSMGSIRMLAKVSTIRSEAIDER